VLLEVADGHLELPERARPKKIRRRKNRSPAGFDRTQSTPAASLATFNNAQASGQTLTLTKTLRSFSFWRWGETMAPFGDHDRDQALSGIQ
jgi:hypothetical protein